MKRYGFTMLTTAQHSPAIRENGSVDGRRRSISYNLRIETGPVERQFVETTLRHGLALLAPRKQPHSLIELLDAHARNLHELMLLLVAMHCYVCKEYKDASAVLRYLDESLASAMAPDVQPRQYVRLLDVNCCLAPTNFRYNCIPDPDTLQEIRNWAENSLRYFDESPDVALNLARIRFLTEDVEGAIQLTERGLDKIEDLRREGKPPLPEKYQAMFSLNAGFLSFLRSRWASAFQHYDQMLSLKAHAELGWDNLVHFIDFVSQRHYEGIEFLQVLYRQVARQHVPRKLRIAADTWIKQDESRKDLGRMLHRVSSASRSARKGQGGKRRRSRKKKR